MNPLSQHVYKFNDFQLDAERFALYHQDEVVRGVEKKSLEVLAVLLRNADRLVSHDEIIKWVWRDNPHGVTPARVNHYVSKLQKVFAKYEPDLKFIENLKGRGYVFIKEVEVGEHDSFMRAEDLPSEQLTQDEVSTEIREAAQTSGFFLKVRYIVALLVLLLLVAVWFWYPRNDEEEVRRVVKDSQMYESLVLYKNPSSFKEEDLDKYWTTEHDIGLNYDRRRIREAVKKLIDEGRRYGDETKCEQFEFQTVNINTKGDFADVKTLEKWFVAIYFDNGTLQKNKYVGPYFVSYNLRKVDGRWLIEKSNTARANPSPPRLLNVEPAAQIVGGQQFFVKLTGEDFLPELIYIKVVGEGCPQDNPCLIPNSALRKHSKLSETTIENVPLTLTSGEFLIYAQNGESKASNPINLSVP